MAIRAVNRKPRNDRHKWTMQRNHWAVAPSTASPWERHSKHWIFLLLQAAQTHLTSEGNKGKRVRYSPVRRNKPYSSNKKHLPQLPQPEFTGKSRMYKCGKYLDIVENSRKECSLWKIVENCGRDYTTQSAQNQHCSKCFYCRKESAQKHHKPIKKKNQNGYITHTFWSTHR